MLNFAADFVQIYILINNFLIINSMFMKKKFINGMLMAALSVATVGSFVACTDHEDDRFLEMQQKVIDSNTELKRLIDLEIADLQSQIDELKAGQCKCGDIKGWVEEQLKLYLKISDAPTDYLTVNGAKELFYTKNEIDNKFYTKSEIDQFIQQYGCKCKEDGYTKEDIIQIINQYLTTNNFTTEGDVNTIVNNLLKEYYTKTEVENLLKNYVTNEYLTQNFYTKEEVLDLINNLTNKFYTKEDIDSIFNNYYTKEEILNLITGGGEGGGLTADQVKEIVKLMLKEYYTKYEIFWILQNYYTKGQIDEMLASIKQCECNLLTIEQIMFLINVENGGNYYNKEQIDKLIGNFVTQDEMITYVTTQINNLETKMQNWVKTNPFGNNGVTIDSLVNYVYSLQVGTGQCACDLADLTKRVEDLEAFDAKYKDLLETLSGTYKAVLSWYNLYKDIDLIKVAAEAESANNWVEANKELVERLKHDVDSLKGLQHGDFSDLENRVKDLENKIKDLKNCECGLDEQKVKDLIKDALDMSDYVTHGEMKEAIEAAQKALQDQIDELKPVVEANAEAIKEINEKLKDMATTTYVDNAIKEALAKLVTSVTLNGTFSPVLGEGSLPIGVTLNVLAAYHGYATSDISFPDYGSAYLANPKEKVMKESDIEMLEACGFNGWYEKPAGTLYYGKDEGKDANAGKLYMTINPNTVNFTGLDDKLSVQTSTGRVVPLSLKNVKKSDKELKFGYTRAGTAFYEADAEVDPAKMDQMKASLNLGDLKDLASDLKDFRTKGFDVTKIVTTIYDEAKDVLPRYCVAVEREDGSQVYSDYALAATMVKPLGFYSVPLASYAQNEVPGIDRVETFIDDVRGKVMEALAKALEKLDIAGIQAKIDNFDWDKFTVKPFTEDNSLVEAVSAIKIDLMNTKDFNETVYVWDNEADKWVEAEVYGFKGENYIYVKINLRWEFERLYNDMGDPINDGVAYIQDFLDSKTFKDMLDLINGLEDRVEGYADRAEDFIMKYVNMFNKRMVRYLDPNDYLKTVLFIKDGNAYTRVRMSAKRPTIAQNSTIKIMPTTFNADILSPCYKKFVAVTNVWNVADESKNAKKGDAACLSELKSANGQAEMMEVTEGNKQVIEFTGKAGYKYEIMYSALDFNGKNMTKKYYIQF